MRLTTKTKSENYGSYHLSSSLFSMNREKDKLAAYLQSIQAAVEETKRQLIGRSDNRTIDAALRQVRNINSYFHLP